MWDTEVQIQQTMSKIYARKIQNSDQKNKKSKIKLKNFKNYKKERERHLMLIPGDSAKGENEETRTRIQKTERKGEEGGCRSTAVCQTHRGVRTHGQQMSSHPGGNYSLVWSPGVSICKMTVTK